MADNILAGRRIPPQHAGGKGRRDTLSRPKLRRGPSAVTQEVGPFHSPGHANAIRPTTSRERRYERDFPRRHDLPGFATPSCAPKYRRSGETCPRESGKPDPSHWSRSCPQEAPVSP